MIQVLIRGEKTKPIKKIDTWTCHRQYGDDADTVGAITGQLIGAYCGGDGIPKEWLSGLQAEQG